MTNSMFGAGLTAGGSHSEKGIEKVLRLSTAAFFSNIVTPPRPPHPALSSNLLSLISITPIPPLSYFPCPGPTPLVLLLFLSYPRI